MATRVTRIDSFQGAYRFLSNFWPAVVHLDNVDYPTVEHAFQAAKTFEPAERMGIRQAATPGTAKRLGREVQLRANWDLVKRRVMHLLLREKFAAEPLRGRLLLTGNAELIEGNTWFDTYWGVYAGKGENWLGILLMRVRKELREGIK